jgi:pilus assembly protein Flp/PilA
MSVGRPRDLAALLRGIVFVGLSLMKNLVQKIWADETGATAIEYGLIAVGIALAIIAVVNGIGGKLNTKFSSINSSLK